MSSCDLVFAAKMAGAKGGAKSLSEFISSIEASCKYNLQRGDIVKVSTGPHDFFRDVREAVDVTAKTGHFNKPPSNSLQKLHLDEIPLIPHDDHKWINNGVFIPNLQGVTYKFHAGMMNRLPVYCSLVYKELALDHRPRVSFYTKNGPVAMRQVNLIEQLRTVFW